MSWTLEIEIEWPGHEMSAPEFERLLREVIDPLERDNVPVGVVRLVRPRLRLVTGGTYIYCKGRYTLASHVEGPWWRCGFCGQLVRLVDNV